MKRGYVFILAALALILAFSGAASAGAASKKDIGVWVNDRKIEFDVPPLIEEGTTYVEFKGLFTALGYTIDYNAKEKVIAGTAPGKTIQFRIGSDRPVIDGKVSSKAVQLIVKEGRTLVPLRFVGEATGMLVDWNAAAQTIKINSKGASSNSSPTDKDRAKLQAFLDQLSKSEYVDRLQYFDPASPIYEAIKNMPEDVLDVKTESQSKLVSILDWKPGQAIITMNMVTKKISGDSFYLDNSVDYKLTLTQDAAQNWKVYLLEPAGAIQYLNTEEVLGKEPTVPEEDKKSLLAVIDKQIQAINDEDIAAYRSTMDPQFPGLDVVMELLKQTFEQQNLTAIVEKTQIVHFTGTEAAVRVSQTTQDSTGAGYRLDLVVILGKSESGEWLLTEESKMINFEQFAAMNSKL
ncbi:hypothetical protein PAECIP111893_03263 [Paenibacillus plantiphilus]|uniref:Copper amine oxidase-like N-terminal domain-containing protein n=1 Tax=Paenibacillus plantiphilus TaxID=2905650 RepID=A0ABN8GM62_9BACL|nr:copper amine oxidase N-terminal domain-containing protein [Paenibacillus plantiphilus]CAH1210748.1 hypothetical protein PAECIP111893_03263 [Paenibacillus plantiphilus]